MIGGDLSGYEGELLNVHPTCLVRVCYFTEAAITLGDHPSSLRGTRWSRLKSTRISS